MNRGKPQRRRAHLDGCRADVALPEMAGVHDLAVLDLDERTELVRFP
jgi:hypothetical protein